MTDTTNTDRITCGAYSISAERLAAIAFEAGVTPAAALHVLTVEWGEYKLADTAATAAYQARLDDGDVVELGLEIQQSAEWVYSHWLLDHADDHSADEMWPLICRAAETTSLRGETLDDAVSEYTIDLARLHLAAIYARVDLDTARARLLYPIDPDQDHQLVLDTALVEQLGDLIDAER